MSSDTKSLDLALNQIEKIYGKGAIMKLTDGVIDDKIKSISTG